MKEMKDSDKIEKLIEKLKNYTISPDELKELKPFFDSEEPTGEINDLFISYWDSSSRHNTSLDINKSLFAVHNKLGLVEGTNKKQIPLNTVQRYVFPIIKYAAIFLLAFIAAFLLLKQGNIVHQDEVSYAENTTVEVSYGSKSKVNLPDGSIVHLNSGSRLTYPTQFKKGKREVFLDGEAHFEVKSDSLNPFWVNADEVVIRVTGTVFNVKSYPGSGTIEATLVSGSLEVMRKDELKKRGGGRKVIRLEPNQKAIYIKDIDMLTTDEKRDITSNSIPTFIPEMNLKRNVIVMPEVAWKDNLLIFENARFEDMIVKLERWYNVKIDVEIEKLRDERFSGKFENETIEQVLKALQLIEVFDYEIKQNKIRIFTNLNY